jgi:hypothetical protein
MKRSLLVFSLGACALLLALFAWHRAGLARNAARTLVALSQRQQQIDAELRSTRAELGAASRRKADQPASAPKTATTSTAPRKPGAMADGVTLAALVRENPQLQLLQLAARRAQLATLYGALWRQLALTPEQIAKFQDLYIAREEQQMDLFHTAQAQGKPMNDPALQKLLNQVETQHRAALHDLLGDASTTTFNEYQRSTAVRELTSGIVGGAALAGVAFTSEQAEQLVQVLANASPDYRDGRYANPSKLDWASAAAPARAFLSAAQVEYLLTTESNGPRGSGTRFQPRFYAAVDEALQRDAVTTATTSPSTTDR